MFFIVEYKAFAVNEILWNCPCHTEEEAEELKNEMLSNNPMMDYKIFSQEEIEEGKHEE